MELNAPACPTAPRKKSNQKGPRQLMSVEEGTPSVGQRIEVLWEDDAKYYSATVKNYRLNAAARYEFELLYADGEIEWLDFGRRGDDAGDGDDAPEPHQVQWRLSESEKKEPKRVQPRRNGSGAVWLGSRDGRGPAAARLARGAPACCAAAE